MRHTYFFFKKNFFSFKKSWKNSYITTFQIYSGKKFSWSWQGGQFKKAIKGQIDIIKTRLFNSILNSVSKIFFRVIVWTNILLHDFLNPDEERKIEKIVLNFFFLHASQSLSYTSQFFSQILWKSIGVLFLHTFFFISFEKRYFDSKSLIVVSFSWKKVITKQLSSTKFYCIENNYYIFLLPEGAFLETKRPN